MDKDLLREMQRNEITNFMNYFEKNRLDPNDGDLIHQLNTSIAKVFKMEMDILGIKFVPNKKNAGEVKLLFVNKGNKFLQGYFKKGLFKSKPVIVYNMAYLYYMLQESNKKQRMEYCKEIFCVVFHEIEHYKQLLLSSKDINNKDVYMYAKDTAASDAVVNDYYNINYNDLYIENAANKAGYERYLEIMGEDRDIRNMLNIMKGKLASSSYSDVCRKGKYWKTMEDKIDSELVREKVFFNCTSFEREIFLKRFPILYKEYNKDGSRKSLETLFSDYSAALQKVVTNTALTREQKKKVRDNINELYYWLIFVQLQYSSKKEILDGLSLIGKKQACELFDRIDSYFVKDKERRLRDLSLMGNAMKKLIEKEDSYYRYNAYAFNNNSGKILVDDKEMGFTEFVSLLDRKLMRVKIETVYGDVKSKRTMREFVSDYIFPYIPRSGVVLLKDGRKLPAKEFVEYIINSYISKNGKNPIRFVKDEIELSNSLEEYTSRRDKIEEYVENKRSVLKEIREYAEKELDVYESNLKKAYYLSESCHDSEMCDKVGSLVMRCAKKGKLSLSLRAFINRDFKNNLPIVLRSARDKLCLKKFVRIEEISSMLESVERKR